MADDMKPVSALDVTKLVPPSPTSVRARLVLLDGAGDRLAKADPGIQEALKRLPAQDPDPADVFQIARDMKKLIPDCLLPKDPAHVLLAFRAIGVEGPYCQFWRREEPSDLRSEMEEDRILREKVMRGELTEEQHRVALQGRESRRWSLVGDEAVEWNRILYARTRVSIGPPGAFTGNPPRTGSGCGRVEQWIALANVMTMCLWAFRNPTMLDRGFLLSGRNLTADDLVIGISDGPPVLATGSREDFSGDPTDNEPSEFQKRHGIDPAEPSLSMAGLAVLVWAVAHQRLRVMYDSVTNMNHRLPLAAIAKYLERSKPILEWDDSDSALLEDVRAELIKAAPLWRTKPVEPESPKKARTVPRRSPRTRPSSANRDPNKLTTKESKTWGLLKEHHGNRAETARELGVQPSVVFERIPSIVRKLTARGQKIPAELGPQRGQSLRPKSTDLPHDERGQPNVADGKGKLPLRARDLKPGQ